jgi:hypothetical protein
MLAEGLSCGLHRIERLMRRRPSSTSRRQPAVRLGERQATAVAAGLLDRTFEASALIANGLLTSLMCGQRRVSSMWLCYRSFLGALSAGR